MYSMKAGPVLLLVYFVCLSKGDIWDETNGALGDFIRTVQDSIDKSLITLGLYEQQIMDITMEVRTSSASAIEDSIKRSAERLEQIRNQKDETNSDLIEECIAQHITELEVIPIYVGNHITECIDNAQADGRRGISVARNEVSDVINSVDVLRKEIDECYVLDSTDCVSKVLIEILIQTLEVPTDIQEVTRRTIDLVGGHLEELPLCNTDRVNAANILSSLVFRLITICAKLPLND